jgi:hypothetical protein
MRPRYNVNRRGKQPANHAGHMLGLDHLLCQGGYTCYHSVQVAAAGALVLRVSTEAGMLAAGAAATQWLAA